MAAGEGPRALRREPAAGPTSRRLLSPSPLSSLGGLCSPAAFLPTGVGQASSRKGHFTPLAPGTTPSSPVEPNVFKHTHTQIFTAQPGSAPSKKKKKIDLVASSLPWCFGRFPVSSSSPRTPGLPHPWGRRDSGLWFWKLPDEVFVCLLLREGKWEEEAQEKGVQSFALVECETPGQHP